MNYFVTGVTKKLLSPLLLLLHDLMNPATQKAGSRERQRGPDNGTYLFSEIFTPLALLGNVITPFTRNHEIGKLNLRQGFENERGKDKQFC